eukprot:6207191-Pleurochrysis_carterae.AAC.1
MEKESAAICVRLAPYRRLAFPRDRCEDARRSRVSRSPGAHGSKPLLHFVVLLGGTRPRSPSASSEDR